MKLLPKLIFCDSHEDPRVPRVLLKLVPLLRDAGYDVFYSESPENVTLNQHRVHSEKFIQDYESIGRPMQLMNRYTVEVAFKKFLDVFQDNKLSYKGVDLKNLNDDKVRAYAISEKGMDARDKKFAHAYLKEQSGVYGIIGYKHVVGMQKHIIEKVPAEKASALFHFVYLDNNPDDVDEQLFRMNRGHLPLDLSIIRTDCGDDEHIARAIIAQLSAKQIELEEQCFNEHVKLMQAKAIELRRDNFINAADKADELCVSISQAMTNRFRKNGDSATFKRECMNAVNAARDELEAYYGWKKILANLGLFILGAGIGYIAAALINKKVTGRYLFFPTDSASKLDSLQNNIADVVVPTA